MPAEGVEVAVEQIRATASEVWQFFYEVPNVSDLSPHEERQETWAAVVDGDRVGMAVVDTFPSDYVFISRVAVIEPYRQRGVGTALLAAIEDEHGRMRCRVHQDNPAGQALVDGAGFSRDGDDRRWGELFEYDTAGQR